MPRTLQLGDKGSDVTELQLLLNDKSTASPKLTGSGQFGSNTDNAVRAFQKQKGLTIDGIVGPRTWAALGKSVGAKLVIHVQDRHERLVNGLFVKLGNSNTHDLRNLNDLVQTVVNAAKRAQLTPTDKKVIYQLHIYGHGNSGGQYVGGGNWLSFEKIETNKDLLVQLKPYFRDDAIVFFRGCSVGKDDRGTKYLMKMSEIWGVPVQAGTVLQKPGVPGAEGVSKRCFEKQCHSFDATWWNQPDQESDTMLQGAS